MPLCWQLKFNLMGFAMSNLIRLFLFTVLLVTATDSVSAQITGGVKERLETAIGTPIEEIVGYTSLGLPDSSFEFEGDTIYVWDSIKTRGTNRINDATCTLKMRVRNGIVISYSASEFGNGCLLLVEDLPSQYE